MARRSLASGIQHITHVKSRLAWWGSGVAAFGALYTFWVGRERNRSKLSDQRHRASLHHGLRCKMKAVINSEVPAVKL